MTAWPQAIMQVSAPVWLHVWVITRIVWRGGHRYQFLECALCGEPRLRIG